MALYDCNLIRPSSNFPLVLLVKSFPQITSSARPSKGRVCGLIVRSEQNRSDDFSLKILSARRDQKELTLFYKGFSKQTFLEYLGRFWWLMVGH